MADNTTPFGWYVATYIERIEFAREDRQNLNRRCRAWENTILVQGRNPEEAYRKALDFAKLGRGEWQDMRSGKQRFVFEGFTSFLPVWEEIQDCCEIFWIDHRNRSVRTVKGWVRPKHQLEAFSVQETQRQNIGFRKPKPKSP